MHAGYLQELTRFRFVLKRDGRDKAMQFATQTLAIYRAAVRNPDHHAAQREYRDTFHAAIRALEQLC